MSKIKIPLFLLLSAMTQQTICSENPMTESVMIKTDIVQLEAQLNAKREALANTAKAKRAAHLAEIQNFDKNELWTVSPVITNERLEHIITQEKEQWIKTSQAVIEAEDAHGIFFDTIAAAHSKYDASDKQALFLKSLGMRRLPKRIIDEIERKEGKRFKSAVNFYRLTQQVHYTDSQKTPQTQDVTVTKFATEDGYGNATSIAYKKQSTHELETSKTDWKKIFNPIAQETADKAMAKFATPEPTLAPTPAPTTTTTGFFAWIIGKK